MYAEMENFPSTSAVTRWLGRQKSGTSAVCTPEAGSTSSRAGSACTRKATAAAPWVGSPGESRS